MSNSETEPTLAFIGAGNMAASLIGGLISDGWNPNNIIVADPNNQQREALVARFQVHSTTSNTDAVNRAAIVLLAVKPQTMRSVAQEIAPAVAQSQPLLISIAAGIRLQSINQWLNCDIATVRVMPNTPALVQSSASVLYANKHTNHEQRETAERILRAVGITLWIDNEDHLDIVTALSGSGPAYYFLLMEALQDAGTKLGLDEKIARLLAIQTAFGSAKMALESSEPPALLRQRVTSPGGTTERALNVLNEAKLKEIMFAAVKAATLRSQELAKQLGAL